jgi:hypothetical protein
VVPVLVSLLLEFFPRLLCRLSFGDIKKESGVASYITALGKDARDYFRKGRYFESFFLLSSSFVANKRIL